MSATPLAEALTLLDLHDNETLSGLSRTPGHKPRGFRVQVEKLRNRSPYSPDRDYWLGLCPINPHGSGRGDATDVIRVPAFWADLDVKTGGLPSWDAAHHVVADLATMLNSEPVYVTMSGHGLQPVWAIDPEDSRDVARAAALLRRFGLLVRTVARAHGGDADSVFDIARVLRAPGSSNLKDPQAPIPTHWEPRPGRPLSLDEIHEALDAYGVPDISDGDTGAEPTPAAAWPWADRTCDYVRAMIAGWGNDEPTARHPWLMSAAIRLNVAHRLGCITQADRAAAETTLTDRMNTLRAADGTRPGEVPEALRDAQAYVETFTDSKCRQELRNHEHDRTRPTFLGEEPDLGEFLTDLGEWLDLPDHGHILAALAAAATSDLDGEPCWLLIVAPPSAGKTEAINLLNSVADARLNEVTAAGLLGWSATKPPKPAGVLPRIGERGLITFGDLSSLLATSDRGGRDTVFGQLRRVYDGHTSRDVQPPGGRGATSTGLTWSGRATVVAAVTGAIDNYSAHADALGPRWLYVRIQPRDTQARRRAARMTRRPGITDRRKTSTTTAGALVAAARRTAPTITVPDHIEDAIEDAALVACWGRATVPRSGYGHRDPIGAPEVEEPPRLVRQASLLALGLLALGVNEEHTAALVRRCLLDSMPTARRAVLTALTRTEQPLTTADVARQVGLHRHVTRVALEDLESVGPIHGQRIGDDLETDETREDRRARLWSLAPNEDGKLIAEVLTEHRRWHEM